MNFFKTRKSSDYTVIIGCGRLGSILANTLSNKGENVLIMDENRDSFRRLSTSFGGLQVVGNGCDLDALKDARIQDATAVVAVTNDDNTNIMVAQMARDIFHVNRVIARLYDQECESVYHELGIETICPSMLLVKKIDNLLDDLNTKEVLS